MNNGQRGKIGEWAKQTKFCVHLLIDEDQHEITSGMIAVTYPRMQYIQSKNMS